MGVGMGDPSFQELLNLLIQLGSWGTFLSTRPYQKRKGQTRGELLRKVPQ